MDLAVGVAHDRGQVAGVGHGDAGGGGFPDGVDRADERAVRPGSDRANKIVKVGEYVGGGQVEGGEGADGGTDLAHGGGRGQAAAHDVADHQGDPPCGQRDDVEPVAADLGAGGSGFITPGDVQAFDGGYVAGQHAALQGNRGGALPGVGAGVGDRGRDPASQFPGGPRVHVGVGPPGRTQAEVDDTVKLTPRHQRHRQAGTDTEMPVIVLRAGNRNAVDHFLVERQMDGAPQRQGKVAGSTRPHLEKASGGVVGSGQGRSPRQVRPDHSAHQQRVRPRVGVHRLVGQQDHALVGELRDDELDQLLQGRSQVQRRSDQPAGPAEQPQPPLHRVTLGFCPTLLGDIDHRLTDRYRYAATIPQRVAGDTVDAFLGPAEPGHVDDLHIQARLPGRQYVAGHVPGGGRHLGHHRGCGPAHDLLGGQPSQREHRLVDPKDPQLAVKDRQGDRDNLEQLTG